MTISNPNCDLCGLCDNAELVCMTGDESQQRDIMIVGDFPGYQDEESGQLISGRLGKILEEALQNAGIDIKEMYITVAVKCRTPNGRAPSAKEMKACKYYLEKEIELIKPKFILLLGAVALKAALGKARIMEIHGSPIVKNGITYFPTFHPAMILRTPTRREPFRDDIAKFARVIAGEDVNALPLDFHWDLVTLENFDEFIRDCYQEKTIAYDLETTGLDRFAIDAAITIFVVSTARTNWVLPLNLPISPFRGRIQVAIVKLLLKTFKKKITIAHNGKFDDLFLWVMYGVRPTLKFDTMLASHLLDENTPNALKYLAQRLFGAPSYDIDLKIKKGNCSTPEEYNQLFEYAGLDGYYTRKLYFVYKAQLKEDPALDKLFKILVMPTARAYEVVETNGVYIDKTTFKRNGRKIQTRMNQAKKKLDRLVEGEVNWNSAAQVKTILFDELELIPQGFTPKGEPSTAGDFLSRMKGQHPILEPLLDYRKWFKMYSGFIEGWEKRFRQGNMLYPGYKIHGTVTGRPSCSDPNLQQCPRDPLIRSLVGAPEGWVHFEADYSQVELRIAAMLSGDPEMMRIFASGGDIHTATACSISGIHEDDLTKEERKKAKPVNFGFLYGMGWRKFKDYARDSYGVIITDGDSKKFRKRFFEMYAYLAPWHKKQRRIAHSMGETRTLSGRIRHLPDIYSEDEGLVAQAERNAINSPVQGFGAELILMSLIEVIKKYSLDELEVAGTIHDAIVGRVRIDRAYGIMSEMKVIMESPQILDELNIELTVPLIVDITMGNWGIGSGVDFTKSKNGILCDKHGEAICLS
ncbi:MAG: DNA polymerase [Nitrosopumilus sp.]